MTRPANRPRRPDRARSRRRSSSSGVTGAHPTRPRTRGTPREGSPCPAASRGATSDSRTGRRAGRGPSRRPPAALPAGADRVRLAPARAAHDQEDRPAHERVPAGRVGVTPRPGERPTSSRSRRSLHRCRRHAAGAPTGQEPAESGHRAELEDRGGHELEDTRGRPPVTPGRGMHSYPGSCPPRPLEKTGRVSRARARVVVARLVRPSTFGVWLRPSRRARARSIPPRVERSTSPRDLRTSG
jgi:hypothetical protein